VRLLFDTSVAIAFRDGDAHILGRSAGLEPVALLSAVSVVELEGGLARAHEGREQRRRALDAMYEVLDILPFGQREAAVYERIVETLGFSHSLIIERMIAAQAMAVDAVLATLNAADFRAIPDLKLDDWTFSPK